MGTAIASRIALRAAAVAALVACGCAPADEPAAAAADPPAAAPDPAATAEALRDRARAYWRARVEEDWPTLYRFRAPAEREGTPEAFEAWSRENDPFRTLEFRAGAALVQGPLGWVDVETSTAMRRFPGIPPRTVGRWQKWRLEDGAWYPVPPGQVDDAPEAPPLRDAAGEARLRERFEASWRARHARDWSALYELLDPEDRFEIPDAEFAATHDLLVFISCEIHWVEAVGDRGRVRATMVEKVNDPSLTKLQPQPVTLIEEWTRVQGEWYLDLLRPE